MKLCYFVAAPTQDIRVDPLQDEYSVGDIINCSASGWPVPSIIWRRMSGPETAGASDGPTLNVVEEMKGERNVWKCIAVNTGATEELLVTFNVTRELKSFIHSFISLISAGDKTHYCYNTKTTSTCVIQA